MSVRNSALRSFSYSYRFPSLAQETRELNARWIAHVVQGQEKYAQAVINMQEATQALESRYATNPPGFNEKYALERQQNELSADQRNLSRAKEQLQYSLQVTARLLSESFQEMHIDFSEGELRKEKYYEYLQQFAGILESGAIHKIFETQSFQDIKAEIAKHLPVTA